MFGCISGLIRRLGCLVFLLAAGLGLYQWVTWPDVSDLALRNPRTTAFIESYEDGQARTVSAEWRWVPYGSISKHLKQAVLVGEDIDFFGHNGFAVEELKSAVKDTVREGQPLRGASTLTQQLAKNLWLSPSRNPWRKVKEALLTLQLEQELDKRRILEVYMNVVEFAPGVYGAEAAALGRYRRSAASLSAGQAAELAACLPSPTSCGPRGPGDAYAARVKRIRQRMNDAGWILDQL